MCLAKACTLCQHVPPQQAMTLPTSMPHSRALAVLQNHRSAATSMLLETVCCATLCTLHVHVLQGSQGGLQATLLSTTQMPAVSTNSSRLAAQDCSQSWGSKCLPNDVCCLWTAQ